MRSVWWLVCAVLLLSALLVAVLARPHTCAGPVGTPFADGQPFSLEKMFAGVYDGVRKGAAKGAPKR